MNISRKRKTYFPDVSPPEFFSLDIDDNNHAGFIGQGFKFLLDFVRVGDTVLGTVLPQPEPSSLFQLKALSL